MAQAIPADDATDAIKVSDVEWPEQTLIIKDLYKKEEGQRVFQEQKLRFITADGFQLTPDFPPQLTGDDEQSINVLILAKGKLAAPLIITAAEHDLVPDKYSHYFIDRDLGNSLFKITKQDDKALSNVHIDCGSEELTSAEATYVVEVNARNGNHYLNYSNFNLKLNFADKSVEFKDLISTASTAYTNVRDTSYRVQGLALNQPINLILRDGVSYQIKLPAPNYGDDVKNPGLKHMDGHLMLERRTGQYLMLKPEDSRAIVLKARRQRVEIPVQAQNTVTSLEGKGSIYQVDLRADALLRISTPDAMKKLSNASTWLFHVSWIDPATIKFIGNKLLIGRTIVYLPDYPSEDIPVEQIYVFTRAGVRYVVDLIFEQVYPYTESPELSS